VKDFKLAVGQWPVVDDRGACLDAAEAQLRSAARAGASLCVLPEMFQTPYELGQMRSRSESIDGESLTRIGALAGELSLWVVAGSICERCEDEYFNTTAVFDSHGALAGVHRKVHLFDVSLETVRVRESLVLSPGAAPLILELPFCRLGVCICYDARFPAIFQYFERQGVEVVAVPAAFSQTTGAAHWHLLMRSRAVDQQVFLAAACPAPNPLSSYCTYGHSLVIDPWGKVLTEAGEERELIVATLEAERLETVRRELPLLKHRRDELYRSWEE
jgi:omega-amidase